MFNRFILSFASVLVLAVSAFAQDQGTATIQGDTNRLSNTVNSTSPTIGTSTGTTFSDSELKKNTGKNGIRGEMKRAQEAQTTGQAAPSPTPLPKF